MNCLTARQTLEFSRPDNPDLATINLASLHVNGCPSCQTAVWRLQQVDAKIGRFCRDVPVPEGLKQRLLVSLEATLKAADQFPIGGRSSITIENSPATVATNEPALTEIMVASTATPRLPVRSRRRLFVKVSVAAMACLALIGFAVFWLQPQTSTISLTEIAGRVAVSGLDPEQMAEFAKFYDWRFAKGLVPQPPTTMRTQRLAVPPRRFSDQPNVAVYFFTLTSRKGTSLEGRLVVVPRRFLKANEVPLATSFLGAPVTYRIGFFTTAWVEGDFAYVCCLSGSENELRRLETPRPQAI